MDMHPFDPFEEAFQSSNQPNNPVPAKGNKFWLGVLVTIVIGGVIYFVIKSTSKKKEDKNQA